MEHTCKALCPYSDHYDEKDVLLQRWEAFISNHDKTFNYERVFICASKDLIDDFKAQLKGGIKNYGTVALTDYKEVPYTFENLLHNKIPKDKRYHSPYFIRALQLKDVESKQELWESIDLLYNMITAF